MHPYPNYSVRTLFRRHARTLALGVVLSQSTPSFCVASICQWMGENGTFWSDESNWEPPVAPRSDGRYYDTIRVNGSSELVYDSALGETVFGSVTMAGLEIGLGLAREPGSLIVTGGKISSAGSATEPDRIGEAGGLFLIRGGVYESGPRGLVVGAAGGKAAMFQMQGGVARVSRLSVALPAGSLRLEGGVLETEGIVITGSAPLKTEARPVRLDGGVICTTGDVKALFTVPQGMTEVAEIHAGGVIFDIGEGKVVVREGLRHGVVSGGPAIDGGLVKEGGGDLYLVAPGSFNGDIVVNRGSLRATKGRNVPNPAETPLGNVQSSRRQIRINDGGVLCLSGNDILGSLTSEVKTPIVVNAGGILTNQHRLLNHAYGMVNRLGPLQLNGGVLHTEGGANARYQSFSFGGPVKTGGSKPSRITATEAAAAKHLGYHLGTATVFDVAEIGGLAGPELAINAPLIDQPPVGVATMAPGGLVKQGKGALRLGEANLHTGVTEVRDGVLELGHSLALQFSKLDIQASGRVELLGTGRTFWLGGLRNRGKLGAEMTANGNRVALSPGAVCELTVDRQAGPPGSVRVSAGELALEGRLVVRMSAPLSIGTHGFRLFEASALSGAFRELAITGSYVAEGAADRPLEDTAGNRFTLDLMRGVLTAEILR